MSNASGSGPGGRDVIVIGGSAGSLSALREILVGLPRDLPATLLVVIHRGLQEPHLLQDALTGTSALSVVTAEEGQRLEHGRVYLAPADRHLLVGSDHVHVRRGPRENRARPAIDPLFRSAAVSCSTRVVGVVLSGMLDDGAAGLLAITRCGGITIVQDPADAAYPEMPRSALRHLAVDHVQPAPRIAPLLVELAGAPRPPAVEAPEAMRIEAMISAQELGSRVAATRPGVLSPLSCPDCHGSLHEIREGGLLRYRCHTGHAYTLEAMRVAQAEAWERALYAALRAQHEQALLVRRMAADADERGHRAWARELEQRADSYDEGAETIRQILATTEPVPGAPEGEEAR